MLTAALEVHCWPRANPLLDDRYGAERHSSTRPPRIRRLCRAASLAFPCWRRPRDRRIRSQFRSSKFSRLFVTLLTCNTVKFSSTLFIIYCSGRCFSFCMKLIMYSHIGDRWMRYTKREFSSREYSVSTFSTTCLPNEHTFVEHVMTMLSLDSYLRIEFCFVVVYV